MKNQNDLIFSIVAVVVFLIVFFVCMGTRANPVAPPAPEQVNTNTPSLPTNVQPVMANALPGASSNNGSGGGGGGTRGMMGPPTGPAAGQPGGGGSSGPAMMGVSAAAGGGGGPSMAKPGGR